METKQNAVQHAPAPWSIKEWDEKDEHGAIDLCGWQVVDAADRLVDTTITEDATETQHATARLIAAAPDLLAALEWLVALLPDPELDSDDVQKALVKKARAAIAKATDFA